MKTVILCGGYGTRIRDVANDIPKPMIPVGGLPILWHIMRHYVGYEHRDFVLCLGYKGYNIKDFFLNYEAHTSDLTIELSRNTQIKYHTNHDEFGCRITFADTGINAMTGARIRRIQKYTKQDDFMLTYGDGVGDVDLDQLLEFHRSHGKILTVTGVRPPGRFGELETDDDGKVMEFNEKPQAAGGLISGGFFVASSKIFDYIEDRDDVVFEQGPMRQLVKDGEMMIFNHKGFWQPMDTMREYQLLNKLYDEGNAPWKTW